MVLVEVDQLRLQSRPILYWLGDISGKGAGVHGATRRAALDLSLVLGDFNPHRWNIEDLPPFATITGHFRQRRLALGTDRNGVLLDMLRLCNGFQVVSRMPSLGARLLATGCA